MNLVFLGANDESLMIAKSLLKNADSLTFFDEDVHSLESIKREMEDEYKSEYEQMMKVTFCTSGDFISQKSFYFDCLPDDESKAVLINQLFSHITNLEVFFTTSKLFSVSKIASFTSAAKQVVGLHYLQAFNQAEIVEVVKGIHTSTKTVEKAIKLMEDVKKEVLVMKDSPGQLLNRMMLVCINEAVHILNEGVASPSDIDKGMELSMGMSVGPLRLADNVGLDVVTQMLNALYQSTGHPKYIPCSLLQNMVYSGFLGRKTKAGFYSYSAEILSFPYMKR